MLFSLLFAICLVYSQAAWVPQMENKGLYQGDMVLTPEQKVLAKKGQLGYALKLRGQWPGGRVYYDTSRVEYHGSTMSVIRNAIASLERVTCLRFQKRRSGAYISFFKGGGCYSYVGYSGRRMDVSLGRGCESTGTAIHEILHALGFYHEQSRRDRDNYLTIYWQNIQSDMKSNFDIARNTDSMNFKYDYESVMHYGSYAFSSNRKPTMLKKNGDRVYRNEKLSTIDIQQINKYYGCSGTGGGGSNCEDKDNRCSGWKSYCGNNKFVKENCKKTCQLC